METYNEAIKFSNSDIKPLNRDVKSTKRRFYSNNGNSFSQAGSEIRIPVSGNFLLSNQDTFLNFAFTWTFVAGTTPAIDFSHWGAFQQIRVESSRQIFEQIDEPAVLANLLSQWNWQQNEITKNNARGVGVLAQQAIATGLLTKSGEVPVTATAQRVSLPLCELMGVFSGDKSVPLMNTSGLTIVLTLATPASRLVFGGTAPSTDTFVYSDFYITSTCIEAGPEYEKALASVKSGNQYNEVSILMQTARRYIGSVAGGSALVNQQIQINDRSKSAMGIWAVSRATADITDYTKYSTSSSCFASYVNHCAVINGTQYPTAQISTLSEAAEESYKVANIYKKQTPKGSQQGGIINRGQMIAAEGTAAGASLCLSVNLSKTGADESMFGSGLDLSTSNSPNVFQVSYTPANASTVTVWVLSQSLLHINGMGQFSTEI